MHTTLCWTLWCLDADKSQTLKLPELMTGARTSITQWKKRVSFLYVEMSSSSPRAVPNVRVSFVLSSVIFLPNFAISPLSCAPRGSSTSAGLADAASYQWWSRIKEMMSSTCPDAKVRNSWAWAKGFLAHSRRLYLRSWELPGQDHIMVRRLWVSARRRFIHTPTYCFISVARWSSACKHRRFSCFPRKIVNFRN